VEEERILGVILHTLLSYVPAPWFPLIYNDWARRSGMMFLVAVIMGLLVN
jgi:hypothetical protein